MAMRREGLLSCGQVAAAACLFLILSVAFQVRGLSPEGLLSDASALRQRGLWARVWSPVPFGQKRATDYIAYFAPYAKFVQDELRDGRLPLWNPYILTGVPVIETAQAAVLHPLTLLLIGLPFESALTVMAIIRLATAGLFSFILARVLGCGVAGATAAGMLFMFSPFHLLFRFHPLPNTSALLPLLLTVSELHVRGGSTRRLGAAWALVGTLMLLGGHAETSVHCVGAAWAYHLLRTAAAAAPGQRWRSLLAAAVFLTVCTCLSVLGAAVVVWGHLVIISESRAVGLRAAFAYRSMPLSHLPSLVLASGFGGGLSGYLGTACLLFAARGAASSGPFPRLPWLVIGSLALLATYAVWPVSAVIKALPLLGVADHSRLLFVVHLCLALLAARGLDAPSGHQRVRRTSAATTGCITLALVVLWLGGWCPGPATRLGIPALLTQPLTSLAAASLVVTVARRWPAARTWNWCVVGLLFADLYAAHAPRVQPAPTAFPPTPPALKVIQGASEMGRVFVPQNLLPANANMVYRVPGIAGYEPSMSRRTAQLLHHAGLHPFLELRILAPAQPDAVALRVLSLLNVRYIITRPAIENPAVTALLEQLASGPVAVYRNPHAFPRAFVVERAVVAENRQHALTLLDDPRVDLRQVVILEGSPPSAFPPHGGAPERPRARIIEYVPGAARVEARAPSGGYLVFSETFSPGWVASVDGKAVTTLRGDYNLVTVPLPPGRHEVRLRYRPLSVIAGGAISAATVLGLLAAALPFRRRCGSPPSVSQPGVPSL